MLNEYVVLNKEFVHDHLNVEIVEIPYHKLVCSLSFFRKDQWWFEILLKRISKTKHVLWMKYSVTIHVLVFTIIWWWFQLFTVNQGILYMYFQNIDLYISQNLLKTRAQKYMFWHVLQQRLFLLKKFTKEKKILDQFAYSIVH